MPLRAPIGTSDFAQLRREGLTYVDKTAHIAALLEDPARVMLLPRPRRFGKTLFLSTLRYFLERPPEGEGDRAGLFDGLAIASNANARQHLQRYPVVFLTFKDLKPGSWKALQEGLASLLADLVYAQRVPLQDPRAGGPAAARLSAVLDRRASLTELAAVLGDLCALLHRATGEQVVILIDEYDTPLHAAWAGGFFDEAVSFFRTFLSAGLKDNPHLQKGVLTGILRLARESIFSGLNNLRVYSLLHTPYSEAFGFTEDEVEALCVEAGVTDRLVELRAWYDGYCFGGAAIYNPWSVLNFLTEPTAPPRPHWVNTSSNELIERLLTRGDRALSFDLQTLLLGGEIEKSIDENLVLRDLETQDEAIWTLLLFSGYLKASDARPDGQARLGIPNREVFGVYDTTFRRWMSRGLGGDQSARELAEALLAGDEARAQERLQTLMLRVVSVHDLGPKAPEKVYHLFTLGLLAWLLPTHEVRSNPESGLGRADVLVIPRRQGQPGCVIEMKRVAAGRSAARTLRAALSQVEERRYAAELEARGAYPIWRWAIAFDGKRVAVQRAAEPGT